MARNGFTLACNWITAWSIFKRPKKLEGQENGKHNFYNNFWKFTYTQILGWSTKGFTLKLCGVVEGKPADLCSTGPRLNPLIHLNLPHIHAGRPQARRQQWLCVLVFFQVLPCSACPSAAVAPPGHTLAPLPISQRRRPNMSLLAGQSSTEKSPCHYNLLLPKRQGWLLLLPTRRIVPSPVESYTSHGQAQLLLQCVPPATPCA